jgi:GT2 family glycosyltransferase
MTTITIVTPWRDHLELAADYWEAVRPVDAALLIVDDGSDPPLPFGDLRCEESVGFSQACNAGLACAETDAVLFLNNDIFDPSDGKERWLEAIRASLESQVLVGAQLRRDRHGDVDDVRMPYLDGWCLAGMREDLVALGGFDEDLEEPAYYSDNLLCLEARAAGMRLRAVRVGLQHKSGATSQPHLNPEVQRVTLANRDRYLARARELLVPA